MRKLTKVGIASLLTLGLAGGATAAFASNDATQAKPDVKKEQTVVERRHDTLKDRKIDRSGKDTYKEGWDHSGNDGGSKDGPSNDGQNDSPSYDLTKG